MNAFWRAGFAATSLDDLTAATGMNRPSLYSAFGDKRALYLTTLDRYIELSRRGIVDALDGGQSLRESLKRLYERALSFYLPDQAAARGCLLISTAATESVKDEEIRAKLRESLHGFDELIEARIRQAKHDGDLDKRADPTALALMASAVLHSLAVRSRAGDSRASLNAIIDAGLALICGGGEVRSTRGRGAASVR